MLIAFINLSGPTHKPQELSVLVSDIVLLSATEHAFQPTGRSTGRGPCEDRLRLREDSGLTSGGLI